MLPPPAVPFTVSKKASQLIITDVDTLETLWHNEFESYFTHHDFPDHSFNAMGMSFELFQGIYYCKV